MERENAKEDPQAEFESACQPTGVITKNNYKQTKARDSEISFCMHEMKTCPRLSRSNYEVGWSETDEDNVASCKRAVIPLISRLALRGLIEFRSRVALNYCRRFGRTSVDDN